MWWWQQGSQRLHTFAGSLPISWSKLYHWFKIIFFACTHTESSTVNWQDWADTSSQLEAISSLAAHVHLTTTDLMVRTYGELALHLVSPQVFMECLAMTQQLAIKIKLKEVVSG